MFVQSNRSFGSAPSPPVSRSRTDVIVLAHRAPFRYERSGDGHLRIRRSPGGLVTAVEPIVDACAGTWVAHGGGTAGARGVGAHPDVPPASSRYRLRLVELAEDEHRGFYRGFANEGLWPLCHAVHVKPEFRPGDFEMYRLANHRFASAVIDEANGRTPLVLVQDYHFALAPRVLRRHLPDSTIVTFWHIPWPHPRVFEICPWNRPLLDGLLASDIVGVQTSEDRANFLDTVEACLGGHVDRAQGLVCHHGRSIRVGAYPVGIEWNGETVRATPARDACRDRVWREFGLGAEARVVVGVDRLDYTKGIREKFLAVERLLDTRPDLRGRFVFIQVAEPSRDSLPAYRSARVELVETRDRVNARFATGSWRPIVLVESHLEPADVYVLYRAADVCVVGSLHDGMNLVAKEFVGARDDEQGVLVLSRFAGASRQLGAALIVNPYDIDQSAAAVARALDMPATEQAARMRWLRNVVAKTDTHWWADRLLADATQATVGRNRLMRDETGRQQAAISYRS